MARSPRVDVQTTTSGVTRIHLKTQRLAATCDVHEDALHTLLVKLVVVSKAHDITQQTRLINLWSGVADAHTAPVGLACDQAIAFEQVARQGFCGRRFVEVSRE